jgi:AraC-like DNA-binding protein
LPIGDAPAIIVAIRPIRKSPMRPEYRNNRDDAPRPVAAMAKTFPDGERIPLHLHKRGQLIHAIHGTMKVETAETAWIVPPALALWMPPALPHGIVMRGELAMRTIYIDPAACSGLPESPMLVEVGGLLRELILAALEEPLDYDESGRGGMIAQLILAELSRMQERKMNLPMPRDARAVRVARALLERPDADGGLDDWADRAGASRRTLARLFRNETGFSFNEWRSRLRAIDGLARLSSGDPVGAVASAVGYASPSAFSAMVRRSFGEPPRRMVRREGIAT